MLGRFGLNITIFIPKSPSLVSFLVIGNGYFSSVIEVVKPGGFTAVSDESKQSKWYLEAYLASFLLYQAWKSYSLG